MLYSKLQLNTIAANPAQVVLNGMTWVGVDNIQNQALV